jgi:hypothetical protein
MLSEQSVLQVKAIMELLFRTTYFQVNDKFLHQEDGMAMGSTPSPILTIISILRIGS